MNLDFIKKILKENQDTTDVFKKNIVREWLQVLCLSFIYSQKPYQDLYFYGGSCLRHCYELPRLSEDLDFIDIKNRTDLQKLSQDLRSFFKTELEAEPKIKVQKFRIYLKFPILENLNLRDGKSESNLLFLKIEIFSDFDFCKKYTTEIIPVFKYDQPMLIKTFDLPTLMATKIGAVLHREWKKMAKNGRVLAKVKARDYFDLMWYLQKDIKPNLDCIKGISNSKQLKSKLQQRLRKMDAKSVRYDLLGLVKDKNFVQNLSPKLKQVLLTQIEQKL